MKISGGVCSERAWAFARMDEIWRELRPETPWGKDYFHARRVYSDRGILESIQDDVDACEKYLDSVGGDGAVSDRLGWHLSRMPRLPIADTDVDSRLAWEAPGLIELFLFKKFLSNYRACVNLLDERTRRHFAFDFSSGELWDALKLGGSDEESFYFSERYDPDLADVRSAINALSASIDAERLRACDAIEARWGIHFAGREFVTISIEQGLAIAGSDADCGDSRDPGEPRLSIESWDDRSCVARLLSTRAMLELEREREGLRNKEKELESAIAAKLGSLIRGQLASLERYRESVTRFDIARARYALAARYTMARPRLGGASLSVRDGRYLPLEKDCANWGTKYEPLNFALEARAAVLFGSNMGGKTVVLKSLVFFQALAQCGFRVPAISYQAPLFDFIEYVGDGESKERGGLSSFGSELDALGAVCERAKIHKGMIPFDEFAHTTSSAEAEALLGAVISWFARQEGSMAFFATHFRGAEEGTQAASYRMGGLDLAAVRSQLTAATTDGSDKSARLRLVARAMRYIVLPCGNDKSNRGSDALEVANLLGLEPNILEDARARLEGKGYTT